MNATRHSDISIKDVSKIFRTGFGLKKPGVTQLNLEVPQGQVVGLLGPNGSGKSTTIKMIMGFLKPTSGSITVCGHPVPSKISRSFIGYLPENPRFPRFLSGRALLNFYGSLLSLSGSHLKKRVDFLLDLVNLRAAANEKVQGYSKGMTQRLAIAQSLLNEPRILIFDEPMSGLDPLGRKDIRKLIAQVHQELPEATIFFSSHILDDVEQLCSSVALLKKGRLQTYCSVETLLKVEAQRFDVAIKQSSITEVKTCEGTQELISFLSESKTKGYLIMGISSHRTSLEDALFKDDSVNHEQKSQTTGASA